jgi:formylglycine-generating enzyme required for sulfatase activity
MIDSLPPNASIIVNGKSTGKVTPSAVELDKQSNVIILKLKGLNNVQFNYDFDPKDPKFKTEYRVFKEFNLRPSIRPVDINKIKFDFVEINPNLFDKGAFWMGSTQDEQDEAIKANKSEETLIRSERLHRVTLTRYFSISTVVVNRRTFKEFLADSSYQMESRNFSSQDQDSDDLPAVNISWKDANEFCKWLTKCAPSDLGTFTLPTEAEWEFACRCGTRTPFSFDDKETELKYYANFNDGFSLNRKTSFGIMKSGLLRSNPWGIHDMHGNIWQYCSDRFGYFEKGDETDPVGPSQGSSRVIRGGSFAVNKFMGRSASRNKMDDFVISDETTGFRVVLRPFSGN